MLQKLFFISDTEMGRGDIMDDFSDDEKLCEYIEFIQKNNPKDTEIKLILNGDIFDFLKMPYFGKFPRYITEEISLWKLEETIKKHSKVFDCLKNYLKNPHHFLHFNIGNHDADLIWPSLQKRIQQELKNNQQISFNYYYQDNHIHAEHGHLQDAFFTINTKKPFIKYKGQTLLNLPWGAYACFSHLNKLKKAFPKEEQIFPKKTVLETNEAFKKASKKTVRMTMLQEIMINPIIKFYDPTYRIPLREFIDHFIHFGLDFIDDKKFIKNYLKKLTKKFPDKKLFVLGHSHVLTELKIKEKNYYITDTWRNEYDANKNYTKKQKTYVEIIKDNNEILSHHLKIFP